MKSLSQWPCGLRRGSSAARLLGFRARIPPWTRTSASCDCCVLSGRGLLVGPVIHSKDPTMCLSECDREASTMRRSWPTRGCCTMGDKFLEVEEHLSVINKL